MMIIFKKTKKPIAVLLIFTLTSVWFFISFKKNAEAWDSVWVVNPNANAAWNIQIPHDAFILNKESILDLAARVFARSLLRAFIDNVTYWIRTGDWRGGSYIIKNWKEYLKEETNFELLHFLKDLNLEWLCEPFAPQVKIALSWPEAAKFSFKQRVECGLWDVLEGWQVTIEDFYNDFRKGNWQAYVKVNMEPQNTFYGSYMIGFDKKYERMGDKAEAKRSQAISSLGYKAHLKLPPGACDQSCLSHCRENTDYGEEYCRHECCPDIEEISTPGSSIHDTIQKTMGIDIDWLISADEIDEVIIAIIGALMDRILSETGLLG